MSHTKVKTTYSVEGAYASTETKTLYCHHNHSSDYTTFYDEDGSTTIMCFGEWETGNDLWDAINRLWFPYKGEWGRSELKDCVEHYVKAPWESQKIDAYNQGEFNQGCNRSAEQYYKETYEQ